MTDSVPSVQVVRAALAEAADEKPGIADGDLFRRVQGALAEPTLAASSGILADLGRLLFENQLHDLGIKYGIPVVMYDHLRDYAHNEHPPVAAPKERRFPADPRWTLLGRSISLPIGVPASVLTVNSQWSLLYARLGYNVITTKTVRPREERAYIDEPPNWLFVEGDLEPITPAKGIALENAPESLVVPGSSSEWPHDIRTFSTLNSFGVPSPHPDVWKEQIRTLLRDTDDDQLVIVSVTGDYDKIADPRELAADFVTAALHGQDAGAHALEVNLSCPNHEGQLPICSDDDLVERIVREVRDSLHAETRLVIKLAYMTATRLERLLLRVADDVDGVAGINTVPVTPLDRRSGHSPFGRRDVAGLSGHAIRDLARGFVTEVAAVRREHALSFDIIASGGVMTADDAARLWDLGADAVQSATGANFNIHLAAECIDIAASREAFVPRAVSDRYDTEAVEEAVLTSLRDRGGKATVAEVMLALPFPPSVVGDAIDRLRRAGAVSPSSAAHDQSAGQPLHLAS